MASETYEFLKSISRGEEPHGWSYPDKLIGDVKFKHPGILSEITIEFDDDSDFLDVLGVVDYERYGWNRVMFRSGYRDYDPDTWGVREDWKSGYLLQNLNHENQDLVKQIMRYINPTLQYSFDGNESLVDLADFLYTRFEGEIDDIIYDITVMNNECIEDGLRKIITAETTDLFRRFGIIEQSHAYKYKTTVQVLLAWYKRLGVEDLDLKELLTLLIEKFVKPSFSYWTEYDECNDWDAEKADEMFTHSLERMLEEVEDEIDDYTHLSEYNKLFAKVTELGGFNKMINLSEKGSQVVFTGLDPETNMLTFKYYKPNYEMEKRSVTTLDDLNLSLYHPELFEERKRFKKLIS